MKTCEQCTYFEKNELNYDKSHCSWFNEEVSNITDACDDFESKPTKAEERARAYADDTEKAIKECYPNAADDAQFNAELAYNAYLRSVEDIMELPLTERLTEEEKEKTRVFYEAMYGLKLDTHQIGAVNIALEYLHGIFGTDFFKEGGEK